MAGRKLLKKQKAKSAVKTEKRGGKFFARKKSYKPNRSDLINAESNLGRTLFGPIPEGHQREFFEVKRNVWIWHEGFPNEQGDWQELTVRYEVRPTGVYKRVNKGKYNKIEGKELMNFRKAAIRYFDLVKTKLYC